MTSITGSESIKELLSVTGPCITVVSPENELRQALKNVRDQLTQRGGDPEKILRPVPQACEELAAENKGRNWIAILRSPEALGVFPVSSGVKPIAKVADGFDLRTLLAINSAEGSFYLLALSQKRTRLLECTQHSSREIPFPAGTPASLADSMQTEKPDHDLENRSTAGPSVGAMKGVLFGTGGDREKKDEYLLHFFSTVDKAVNVALKEAGRPLVVVAVEQEVSLYRRVSTYPHLVEPGIHGSPDSIEGGELHRRALDVLSKQAPPEAEKALADFDKKVGTGHASVRIPDIIAAAYEGRVSHLFFQENAKYEGTFDEIRQRVRHNNSANDEFVDLIEGAAFQTIMHGGEARILSGSAMPNGAQVCAILRYPAAQAA